MFSKVSRGIVSLTLLGLLAGCNSSSTLSDAAPGGQADGAAAQQGVVVQATCPQINFREDTAVHRVYARGGEGDGQKIVYQAALADTTRSCTTDGVQLTINVMAQGRILAGPEGSAGPVTLPVNVTVTQANALQQEETIYSQTVNFPVEIPADTLSAQFIFSKADVTIPAAAASSAKVYLGFDAGPQARR